MSILYTLRLIVPFLGLLFPLSSTFARPIERETQCTLPQWAVDNKVYYRTIGKVTCDDVKRVFDLFSLLNTSYIQEAQLSLPNDIIVELAESDSNSLFDGYRLDIPLKRFVYTSNFEKIEKTEEESLPVRLHEYGHAVFSSSLAASLPEFAVVNAIDKARSKSDFDGDLEGYKTAVAKFSELFETYNAIAPYHEFFADAFSVIYLRKGQAMADVIINEGVAVRDYKLLPNFEGFLDAKDWMITEPHAMFNPARTFLWRRYLAPEAQCNLSSSQKLAAVYSALKILIRRTVLENRKPARPDQVSIRNEELIDALSMAFKNPDS